MNKFFCILLSSLFAISLNAQESIKLTQCVKQAIESNYNIKIAVNREAIAANNVTIAPFIPSLSVGATQDQDRIKHSEYYNDPSKNTTDNYVANYYNANVSLSWRLFDGMSMFATHQTQKQLLREGELNLRANIEQLISDISSQYYYIITQQNRLKASERYLEISILRFSQANEKYGLGVISGLEMKQAKIDLNADSSNLVRQREIIQNAYIRFYEMMNIDLNSSLTLYDTITLDNNLSLSTLKEQALDRNTNILLVRNGQKISELDLKIARSSRYPTLDLVSSYGFNRNSNSMPESALYSKNGVLNYGLTLSMKIFDRMEVNRKIKNASIELKNRDLMQQQVVLEVTSTISQLYNTYRKNLAMINFEVESAEAAMLNLEAAMEMYRLGSMSGVQFREIQRSYLEATERQLEAQYLAKVSEINLLLLSGSI